VDTIAESRDIFGDKEDEEEAIDDPLGRPSVFSSVRRHTCTFRAINNLPVFLFIGIYSWVLDIHNRFRCGVWDQQSTIPFLTSLAFRYQ
jgi:hypothetical protein